MWYIVEACIIITHVIFYRFQQPAMCVEIPVETPAVNMYYLNDIEQILHWRCV